MKPGPPKTPLDPLSVFWLMCLHGRQEKAAAVLNVSARTLQRHAVESVAMQFALDAGAYEYRRRTYPHGSASGYRCGCRCARCTHAHALQMRRSVAERRTRLADAPHGTYGGYSNWGCRCDPCTTAHSAGLREAAMRRAARGG